jgi:predicted  nucleic acid-binding Zn-ribbon protein
MKLTSIQQATFPTRWAGCEASLKKIFEQLGHEKEVQAAWNWAQRVSVAVIVQQKLVLPSVLKMINSDAPAPYRKLGKVRQFSEELVASHAQYFPAIQELRAHPDQKQAARINLVAEKINHRKNFDRKLKRKRDLQSRLKEKESRLKRIPGEISATEANTIHRKTQSDQMALHGAENSRIIESLKSDPDSASITKEKLKPLWKDLLVARPNHFADFEQLFNQKKHGIFSLVQSYQKMKTSHPPRVLLAFGMLSAVMGVVSFQFLAWESYPSWLSPSGITQIAMFLVLFGLVLMGFFFERLWQLKMARGKNLTSLRAGYADIRNAIIKSVECLQRDRNRTQRETHSLRKEHRVLLGEITALEGKIERLKHDFVALQCAVDAWPSVPKYPQDAKFPAKKVLNSLQSSLPTINAAAKEARGKFSQELKKMKGRLDRS